MLKSIPKKVRIFRKDKSRIVHDICKIKIGRGKDRLIKISKRIS